MASKENDRVEGFIISHQRSGSTYLRACLNQVETITVPSESHFLVDYYKDRLTLSEPSRAAELINEHPRVKHWRKENVGKYSSSKSLPEFFFDLLADQSQCADPNVVLDKTPEYLEIAERLVADFPDAKFIFLVRHSVDVTLSLENRGWQGPFQENRMQYWLHGSKKIWKLHKELPENRSLLLKYEDLMSDPESVSETLSSFLGVKIEPDDLSPRAGIQHAITEQERKLGIHKALELGQKVDRKRQDLITERQRSYMLACTSEMLYLFGYLAERTGFSMIQRIRFTLLCCTGSLIRFIPDRPARILARIRRVFVRRRANID